MASDLKVLAKEMRPRPNHIARSERVRGSNVTT